jgi:hypothetical protein
VLSEFTHDEKWLVVKDRMTFARDELCRGLTQMHTTRMCTACLSISDGFNLAGENIQAILHGVASLRLWANEMPTAQACGFVLVCEDSAEAGLLEQFTKLYDQHAREVATIVQAVDLVHGSTAYSLLDNCGQTFVELILDGTFIIEDVATIRELTNLLRGELVAKGMSELTKQVQAPILKFALALQDMEGQGWHANLLENECSAIEWEPLLKLCDNFLRFGASLMNGGADDEEPLLTIGEASAPVVLACLAPRALKLQKDGAALKANESMDVATARALVAFKKTCAGVDQDTSELRLPDCTLASMVAFRAALDNATRIADDTCVDVAFRTVINLEAYLQVAAAQSDNTPLSAISVAEGEVPIEEVSSTYEWMQTSAGQNFCATLEMAYDAKADQKDIFHTILAVLPATVLPSLETVDRSSAVLDKRFAALTLCQTLLRPLSGQEDRDALKHACGTMLKEAGLPEGLFKHLE